MITSFIGVLFDGVAYGSLLFLISIGLSVTMGLMNFINLAHGAFAMLGGYAAFFLYRAGVPALLGVPIAALALFILGWLPYRAVVFRVVDQDVFISRDAPAGIEELLRRRIGAGQQGNAKHSGASSHGNS